MTMTTLHVTSLTLHTKCIYIIPFLILTALPSNHLCKHSQTDIFENTKHRKINIILTFQSKYSFKYKQFQTYTQYYQFLVTLRYITMHFLSNIMVKLFIEFQEILNLKKRVLSSFPQLPESQTTPASSVWVQSWNVSLVHCSREDSEPTHCNSSQKIRPVPAPYTPSTVAKWTFLTKSNTIKK